MTTKELFENLLQGKKMRLPDWEKDYYVFIDKDGSFKRHDGKAPAAIYTIDTDWQEYKEEILDKEEKEYLEAVLRPFKDSIRYVEKQGLFGEQYIQFCYESFDTENPKLKPTLGFNLPRFKANTMYQGMDLGVPYTLRELGLFKNKEEK